MTAALKGNADGSGAIQVGGVNAINISTSQIVSFPNSLAPLTLTGLSLAAGTTTVAPLTFNTGSLLTNPVVGAIEFDGNTFYGTDDLTDGRGFIPTVHYLRLTSDGSTISTIANFFGSTSGVSLDSSVFYELEANLYFLKTTAGTVTFTMTFSNAPINNNANYVGSQATGVGSVGAPVTAALIKSTATAGALPTTASLTSAANHQYIIRSMFQANATTGGTINLRITSSAGTVTPLTGSYYKLTRLPADNTGTFA